MRVRIHRPSASAGSSCWQWSRRGAASTYPAPETSDAVMAADMDTGKVLWSYQVHRNDSFIVGCDDNCIGDLHL